MNPGIRILYMLLLCLMCVSFSACFNKDSDGTPGAEAQSTPEPTASATQIPTSTAPQIDQTPTEAGFDRDGDGYGSKADCNDYDVLIYPGANEVCDGQDGDCDGLFDEGTAWFHDSDHDGYGEADDNFWWDSCDLLVNPGEVADSSDCDDRNGDINPGAQEVCDDKGGDEDCDRLVNDEDPSMTTEGLNTFYPDGDGDGYGSAPAIYQCAPPQMPAYPSAEDCDDNNELIHPGAEEACDVLDNDCDSSVDEGIIWYRDSDGDGYGDRSQSLELCPPPEGYVANYGDCNDESALSYPEAEEICDYIDNDCDIDVDEGFDRTWYADLDGDGYGDQASTSLSCVEEAQTSRNNEDCDDLDEEIHPGAEDAICDGVDDDCDGEADDAFEPQKCGVGLCHALSEVSSCEGGQVLACIAAEPQSTWDAVCDALDSDCDGLVDEDYVPLTTCGVGYCAENAVAASCTEAGEIACAPGQPLSSYDSSCDEVDDDCDGRVDENCAANCSDLPSKVQSFPLCDGYCRTQFTVSKSIDVDLLVTGMASDGERLILSDFYGAGFYELDKGTEKLSYLFASPNTAPTGVQGLGDSLWTVDIVGDTLTRLSLSSGTLLGTESTPDSGMRDLDYANGRLWGLSRDSGLLYQFNVDTLKSMRDWSTGLSDASGLGFCEGFPLLSNRSDNQLHLFDLSKGSMLESVVVDGVSEPYAISCEGSELWISDSLQQRLVLLEGPLSGGHLDSLDHGAGASTLPIEREQCSSFDLYHFGLEGIPSLVEIVVAAQDSPLVVALFAGDDTVLFSQRLDAESVLRLPTVSVDGTVPYYLEVSALENSIETDYGLWVRQNPVEMKVLAGQVFGDGYLTSGATVQLRADDFISYSVSRFDGSFGLGIPVESTPDFVAVTGGHADFVGDFHGVDTRSGREVGNFYLHSPDSMSVLVEGTDTLIHLGDDNYAGDRDKQHLSTSDGLEMSHIFNLSEGQASSGVGQLSLWLRGTEFENPLFINDIQIASLSDSPEDGSYGLYQFEFDPDILRSGENTLRISSQALGGSGYDDFEYVLVKLSFDGASSP